MIALIYTMLWDAKFPHTGFTRDHFTLANLCRAAFHTEDDYEPLKDWMRRAADSMPEVKAALSYCYDIKAQVTRDGYVSSLNEPLNKYAVLPVAALTARSDIDLRKLVTSPDPYVIFVVTDDRSEVSNTIATMFLNDLISALTEYAKTQPNEMLPRDVILYVDEMGNLPPIPGLMKKITTLRSRKIWMQMAVQSLEQMDSVYGQKVTRTILDNTNVQYFLGCR